MSSQPITSDGLPSVSSTELSFQCVRDECVRAYQPATPEEMLLVQQIARAWFRLQRYYDFELTLMEEQRLSKMFETDLERFNSFNRALASAERMWRNAVRELHAARRRKPAAAPTVSARRAMRDTDEPAAPIPASTAVPRASGAPPLLRIVDPVMPPATRSTNPQSSPQHPETPRSGHVRRESRDGGAPGSSQRR